MSRCVQAVLVALALVLVGCTSGASTSSGELGSSAEDPAGETNVVADALNIEPAAVIAPTPTPEGPRPLVVMTLLGETGVMDRLDAPALSGVVAEIDRLNDEGGVLGRQIELVRYDTNSRTSIAQRTMERVVDQPPDLIVVSCDTTFSQPVLDLADDAGLLTISPCADDPRYLTGALGLRNFTLGAPAEARGTLAAQSAFERYGTTAIVLRDVTSPEALGFCDGFERSFRELGGSVVYRDEFSYDTLPPVEDRLSERGRDTSFITICSHVPGLEGNAMPEIVEMVRRVGFQAPIVAGSSVDERTWFAETPVLGDLTYISWSSIFGNDPDDRINDVMSRVDSVSRTLDERLVVGVSTILGAETIEAWARAVERARDPSPERVAAALGSFSGERFATGQVSFVAGARMDIGRTYRVLQVSQGELNVIALESTPD